MRIIRARAPLRLGLAGGGTDVSPFCDTYGGNVLNATIDRYAYATLKIHDGNFVSFIALDQSKELVKKLDSNFDIGSNLVLHEAVYYYMIERYYQNKKIPLVLSTFCDAPAGSGLGSSSTLVVAMIRSFVELFNLDLNDYEVANLAHKLERDICGFSGGRQDQFSATFGGFNFMEFYADNRTVVNSLKIKNWIVCELEASFILYFTGISRDSDKIIHEQSANVKDGILQSVEAMHAIKQEAIDMKSHLITGNFSGIVESMRYGWEQKKKLAKSVSNSYIDEIYEAAMHSGALAGKISGAGGGGFMLFYVPSEKRIDLINNLKKYGGILSNVHFVCIGSQSWQV